MQGILVRNELDKPVTVPRKIRLGIVIDINSSCYMLDTARPAKTAARSWFKTTIAATSTIAAAFSALVAPSKPSTVELARCKTKLANGIIVYRSQEETRELTNLIKEFPSL